MNKLIINLFLLIGTFCIAQQRNIQSMKPSKQLQVAKRMIEENSYYGAIPILEKLSQKYPDERDFIFYLGMAHFKSRNFVKAEAQFLKLYSIEKEVRKNNQVTSATFFYAMCLKSNGQYEKAREVFQMFVSSNYKPSKGESNLKSYAKQEIVSCEYGMEKKKSDVDVQFVHLGSNLNSAYAEFAPSLKDDSTLIYSSLHADSVIVIDYDDINFNHVRLMESVYDNGKWNDPKPVSALNDKFLHTSNGTFNFDRTRYYFTRCKTKNDNSNSCAIYMCEIKDNTFSKPKKLGGGVNAIGSSNTQPIVGKFIKGKREEEALYFASDRKGGMGGMDIWFAPLDKKGLPSKPANCGKQINSPRDEVTPYYDSDAGVLYFSSNHWPGIGGQDVFKSKGWGAKWGRIENLKSPVNSSYDDTYYTLLPHNKLQGMMSTNRPGAIALTHETCCEDIWQFEYKKPAILVARVLDSLSGETLKQATLMVEVAEYDPTEDADSSLISIETQIEYDTVDSNDDPHFLKLIGVKEKLTEYYIVGNNRKAVVSAKLDGYIPGRVRILTDSQASLKEVIRESGSSETKTEGRVSKIDFFMVKEPVRNIEEDKLKLERKDTVRIHSTLKAEYLKVAQQVDGPPTPIIETIRDNRSTDSIATPKKEVIEEVDFTINLTFEFKQVGLNNRNKSTLDSVVYLMQKKPFIIFEVSCHTDGIGSENYNMALSQQRAAYIGNYLIQKGIKKNRIRAKGYGETRPLVKETHPDGTDNPAARDINRRTEIRFHTGKQ